MSANLPQLIDAFAVRGVLVVGEAMLDSYLEGHTGRFCPEAPAPPSSKGESAPAH